MILNNQLLEFICIVAFITAAACQASASRSQPTNMQTKKIQIYTTTTTSASSNFSFTFDNSLVLTATGGNQPTGLITMSSLDFTPISSQSFWCSTTNVTTTSMLITCTISSLTIVNKIVYNYFVMARDQSYFIINSVVRAYLWIQQVTANTSNVALSNGHCNFGRSHSLNGTNYLRGFLFLRGIEHALSLSTFNMNITLNVSSSTYTINFTGAIIALVGTNPVSRVFMSILIFDMSFYTLNRNYSIVDAILAYRYGQPVTSIPVGIDTTTSWMLVGLKSVSFSDSQPLTFQFSYSINNDIVFNSYLPYNEIQYVWISQLSCPTGTYFERAQGVCKTDRNGCTNYYQYISGATSSQITGLYMHNSRKIFAVASAFEIRIYRHNSANFVLYTNFYIALQSSKINKIEFSADFSRVAILCLACGFYIYSWNGTKYALQYMIPSISNSTNFQYLDFSIKQDFKMVTIIYSQNLINKRITLTYNNQTRNFSLSRPLDQPRSSYKLHVNYTRNQAYFHSSYFMEYMIYDPNFQFFVPYLPSIQIYDISFSIISVTSGDKRTLAMDYIRAQMNPYNAGIKILQYNQTLRMFVFHSQIKSIGKQNFGVSNYLKLSYDGLKLLVKAIGSLVESRLIFERASITDEFVLTEIITNPQPIPQNYTRTLGFIDASDNFQTILSTDGTTNVVLYYCPSTIPSISTIYEIPVATSMFATAQQSSSSSQSSQLSTKIDSMAQSNEQVQTDVNNLKQDTKQIKDLMNVLLPVVYGVAGVVTVALLVLMAKFIQNARTNPQSDTAQKRQLRLNSINSGKFQTRNVQNSELTLNYEKSNNSRAVIVPQILQTHKDPLNSQNQPNNLTKKEPEINQRYKRKRQRFSKSKNIRQEQPEAQNQFLVEI